jgi:hypothetical protein
MGIDDESSHPEVCSEVAGGVTRNIVCLFREPDAGNLPVRFDEREQETELRQTGLRRTMRKHPNSHREAKATAPVLDSTQPRIASESASIYRLHFVKADLVPSEKTKRNILWLRNEVHAAEPFPHIGGF